MRYSGWISDKEVNASERFIVHSPVRGLIGEASSWEKAHRIAETERLQCAERGRVSDACMFQWEHGHWYAAEDLYEQQNPPWSVARVI
ncbi:MAG: hypothetical protein AB1813_04760 [Verrucomicrobiota bacterium]|jgi:hypothetical protein